MHFDRSKSVFSAYRFFYHREGGCESAVWALWLSLAIEFELAADILRTTIAPSWEEIGKLAAIVILRTVLNYFLQTEIRRAAQQKTATAG